jgi:hypothetical protein
MSTSNRRSRLGQFSVTSASLSYFAITVLALLGSYYYYCPFFDMNENDAPEV